MTIAHGVRQPCDDPASRPPDHGIIPCPAHHKPWVLATAILGSSVAFIESSVVNLALPAMQSNLGATSTALQWVVNAYLLVLGSCMLIGGSLGDRFGLRRVFITGLGIFAGAALACALSPSLPLLVSARVIQGLGGALLVPTSLALIVRHFDDAERGRAIGTWAGASALTTAIGPVLGGWLVDRAGWPAVFYLVAPLAAATILLAWWRVPVSPVERDRRLDWPGAVLLAAAIVLCLLGLMGTTGSARGPALAASGAVGLGFLWWEKRATTPMLPPALFRVRAFSGANAMTVLLYGGLSGALYFLPFNLIQVHGYSAVEAGGAFLPFTLIMGFGSILAGNLQRRFPPRGILTVGPTVTAMGFALLALSAGDPAFMTGVLPGMVVVALGMTLSVAPLTTVVMSAVSGQQAGIASGVNNTAARLAGVLAVALLTAMAVGRFQPALETQLRERGLPLEVIEQLRPEASRLAELTPPATAAAHDASAIRAAVSTAYVGTFRSLLWVCCILAILSALVAWGTLGPRRQNE